MINLLPKEEQRFVLISFPKFDKIYAVAEWRYIALYGFQPRTSRLKAL